MSSFIADKLKTNLMSDVGITHLKTFEHAKVIRIARKVAIELGYSEVVLWKRGDGLRNMKDNARIGSLEDLAVGRIGFQGKTLIILQDIHRLYEDQILLMHFQEIMEKITKGEFAINTVGVSQNGQIPEELERYAQIEIIGLPSKEEIFKLVKIHFANYGVSVGRSMLRKLSETLLGLIEDEIPPLLNKILVTCHKNNILIDSNILGIAQEQKKQIIQKSGILKFVTSKVGIDEVGGLYNLKTWLREKKEIFDDTEGALKYGIKPPKGVLLFGMPGSGKSLVAKVVANFFKLPLLRVDMGLIYGQKSPEEAIEKMISLADAISPCVLWIDELEKALSGSESGGANDVSIKILGQLLTWMQERSKPVFIVATANDISMIRPETYRDGRIDEKFMLGFLGKDISQIAHIIEIHLKTRLKDEVNNIVRPLNYNAIARKMTQMVAATGDDSSAGYTGANMEALVEKVLQDRFTRGRTFIETKDFVRMLNYVYPQHGIEIKRMLKRAKEMEAKVA